MAAPWERYAQPEAAPAEGPWARYAQPAPAVPQRGAFEQAVRVPAQAAAGFNDRLADVLGGPVDLVGAGLRAVGLPVPADAPGGSESIRRGIRSITGAPSAPEGTLEEAARGAGRGVVDAGTMLVPGAALAQGARAGSLAQRVGTAATALPGLQVASGVAGGAVTEAADSPLAGAAAALALPFGAAGAARLVSPIQNTLSPARAALVQAAEREGIPLSAGQATGSRVLQNMEGAMAQLPGTSGAEAAFAQGQQRAFNRAVLQRAGVDADSAAPEVLNTARAEIGGRIGEIARRNTLDASPPEFLDELVTASNNARRYAASDVERSTLNRIDDVLNKVEAGDTIPGQAYRELDSELGRAIRGTQNGDLRNHLGDVRETMRRRMDESIGPEDAEAWQEARRQYANLMVAAKAAGGAGANTAEGNISPLALRGALDQSTGGGYVWGRGDMNELSRIGQGVLRAPPDSGTAGRSQMNQLLTGGGLSSGGAGVGALIGGPVGAAVGAGAGLALPAAVRAAYTNPLMQAYLRNQVVQGQTRQAITGLRRNVLLQQSSALAND
jgi:hypothetical protein